MKAAIVKELGTAPVFADFDEPNVRGRRCDAYVRLAPRVEFGGHELGEVANRGVGQVGRKPAVVMLMTAEMRKRAEDYRKNIHQHTNLADQHQHAKDEDDNKQHGGNGNNNNNKQHGGAMHNNNWVAPLSM